MRIPIFISYGHHDNNLPPGWVSEFGSMLKARLLSYVDEDDFSVWFDRNELDGNVDIWPRIQAQLDEAQILVPILSARYVTSESCLKEFRHYYDAWSARGGLRLEDDSTRLFRVVKVPVAQGDVKSSDLPDTLKSALLQNGTGFEFYRTLEKGAPIELTFKEDTNAYLEKLADLAFAMKKLIVRLQGDAQAQPTRGTIYLAETPVDVTSSRDLVRRELEERGYSVLPAQPIDWNSESYAEGIARDLARCNLSIHVIGGKRGVIPDETQASRGATLIQLDAALAESQLHDRRIVWLPPTVTDTTEMHKSHREFVDRLLNGHYASQGVEVVRTRDALWDVMKEKLSAPVPAEAAPARQRIFLVCDEADAAGAGEIVAWLESEGFDVLTSTFDQDAATRLRVHRDFCAISDAVLLYYADAPDGWFKQRYVDLIRLSGEAESRQKMQAVYVGGRETPSKALVRGRTPLVLKAFGAFQPEALAPFVEGVRRLRGHERRIDQQPVPGLANVRGR